MAKQCDDVLDFWVGPIGEDGWVEPEQSKRWWKKDPDFDATIRTRFGNFVQQLLKEDLQDAKSTPANLAGSIIALDQFTRNMYRDTPQMYVGDKRALELCDHARRDGYDVELPMPWLAFVLMPLMHAEDMACQDACVEEFARHAKRAEEAGMARAAKALRGNRDFAVKHKDIVARFGRFPHRNVILGRESTPEELEFLKQPGSGF